jgi:hypothetical protein
MRELTRSQNYVVQHEYEDAFLVLPDGRRVAVGSFYGDPTCALIDQTEQWCVIAGCELVVYFLREPFSPVDIFPSEQYAWVYPTWAAPPWVVSMSQPSPGVVRFSLDPAGSRPGVYELRFPTLEVVEITQHL